MDTDDLINQFAEMKARKLAFINSLELMNKNKICVNDQKLLSDLYCTNIMIVDIGWFWLGLMDMDQHQSIVAFIAEPEGLYRIAMSIVTGRPAAEIRQWQITELGPTAVI